MATNPGPGQAFDPNPEFLQWMDRDPERAFEGFYGYAFRLLTIRPPRELRFFEDEREDLIQEVVLHCCAENFRVLRQFDPQKAPFPAWFHFVARNRTRDLLQRRRTADAHEIQESDEAPERASHGPTADRVSWAGEALEAVQTALEGMSDRCRTLLLGAAEELGAKELAPLVGLPATQNKKVADDLRYCRRRLLETLTQAGFDPDDFIRNSPRRSETS